MSTFSIILILATISLLISLYYIKNSKSEKTKNLKEKPKEKIESNIIQNTENMIISTTKKKNYINQVTHSTYFQVNSNSLSTTENSKNVQILKNANELLEKSKEDTDYLTQLKNSNSPLSSEDAPLSDTSFYVSIPVLENGNLSKENLKNFKMNDEKELNETTKKILKKDNLKRGGLKKQQAKKVFFNSVKISNSKEAEMRKKRLSDRLTKGKDKNNTMINKQLRKSDKNINSHLNNYKKVVIKNDL